jgi:hypothetical protein
MRWRLYRLEDGIGDERAGAAPQGRRKAGAGREDSAQDGAAISGGVYVRASWPWRSV